MLFFSGEFMAAWAFEAACMTQVFVHPFSGQEVKDVFLYYGTFSRTFLSMPLGQRKARRQEVGFMCQAIHALHAVLGRFRMPLGLTS